jgi:3-oxoacyl-[acyl-carrier-protein] synthase II
VIVVEELQHARDRGARIYAEVLSFASGFDRGRTGCGLARIIGTALERAGVGPDDLDHVNAHAPGTTDDDAWEARGIAAALGEGRVGVLAVKSYLGNLGPGASAVELAASVLGLAEGWRPGTLNHEETDPECPVSVLREPGAVRRPHVLKLAGTDMGQCAAIVLRRWDADGHERNGVGHG